MEPFIAIAALTGLLLLRLIARDRRKRGLARRRPRRYDSSAPRRRLQSGPYVGDYAGPLVAKYAPQPDGRPDPGEVVWTWVPFEEDHSRGKDRPVLLVGHDGPWLLGLQLSTIGSSSTAPYTDRHGHRWHGIGSGPWDPQRRPSAVRLDRIVCVHPDEVRREGAILDRRRFNDIARSLRELDH